MSTSKDFLMQAWLGSNTKLMASVIQKLCMVNQSQYTLLNTNRSESGPIDNMYGN